MDFSNCGMLDVDDPLEALENRIVFLPESRILNSWTEWDRNEATGLDQTPDKSPISHRHEGAATNRRWFRTIEIDCRKGVAFGGTMVHEHWINPVIIENIVHLTTCAKGK